MKNLIENPKILWAKLSRQIEKYLFLEMQIFIAQFWLRKVEMVFEDTSLDTYILSTGRRDVEVLIPSHEVGGAVEHSL